ncbi:MAG: hypothetical protein IJ679_00260 [Lachnospiraceae bacterium]|nr:hypothetical protein [Lachnospiraceae bacterium]
MRKKIWRMSEDQFDIVPPKIKFSEEKIEIEAVEHTQVRGGFSFESINGASLRGVCYSTHPYVRILRPQFEGVSARIEFRILHDGFGEGDEIEGEFCVVFNGSEEYVPFTIRYIRRFPETSVGRIDSDAQFARLAKEHWNEAMQLFYSKSMRSFIDSLEIDRILLYQGFSRGSFSQANLEAYLVATGSKDPVIFTIDESDRNYYGLTENQREMIEINRSNWGYIDISVSCDADFITLEKERITADFFMGSRMQLSMYLHPGRMHAGRNVACISFSSSNSAQEIHIMATSLSEGEDYIPPSYTRGMRLVKLTRCYEDYRFEKISSAEWSKESAVLLDALIGEEPDPTLFRLMKAHVLIVGGEKQKALWIIQEMRREIEDRTGVAWAYLLYLCTLIEKEEDYIDRLLEEIEAIFVQKPAEPMIFWFLLFLRKEYIDDYKRRLKDIARWMLEGVSSPFFYIEAEYLLRQEPYLLTKFDTFSKRILGWMLRKGRMTEALADQVSYVLEGERSFREDVYAVVKACYEIHPTDAFLGNVVTYLLRNHKYGPRFRDWYEKAVFANMNFTGLYEAYVLSLPLNYSKQLPQMVVMYFRYQNTLPAVRKAFVYANVIVFQKSQLRIYEQYVRHMEEFALDMARQGRIDDNLAVVYQHIFLECGILDEDVANEMGNILFYHKIFGLDSDIVRVHLYQECMEAPIVVSVENHLAYVPVYSAHYRIFLEDRQGVFHSDPSEYYIERLMQPGRSFRRLYGMATKRLHYFLHELQQREEFEEFAPSDIPNLVEFMDSDEVSERYKQKMYPAIMRFMTEHGRREELESHFLKVNSFDGVDAKIMTHIIDLYIIEGEYDRAYDLLLSHNGIGVPGKSLLNLCSYRIKMDEDKADDFLIELCAFLMRQFLSSEETIVYLNRFLIGPTRDMVTLWQFASARSLETRALEERILSQMLFTENIDTKSESIYNSYLAHHPNRMVASAYATYFARRYLLTGESAPDRIFEDALHLVLRDEELNDSVRIALCMHLAKTGVSDKEAYEGLNKLMADFVQSGTYFAFFKDVDHRLVVKYHLYDKTFVEYRGKTGERLLIRYRVNDGASETLEMTEMYPGIYVRLFVLFFGDRLTYTIVKAADQREVLMEDGLHYTSTVNETGDSRYERINAMQSAFLYSNEKQLLEDMKEYERLDSVTEMLFSML